MLCCPVTSLFSAVPALQSASLARDVASRVKDRQVLSIIVLIQGVDSLIVQLCAIWLSHCVSTVLINTLCRLSSSIRWRSFFSSDKLAFSRRKAGKHPNIQARRSRNHMVSGGMTPWPSDSSPLCREFQPLASTSAPSQWPARMIFLGKMN